MTAEDKTKEQLLEEVWALREQLKYVEDRRAEEGQGDGDHTLRAVGTWADEPSTAGRCEATECQARRPERDGPNEYSYLPIDRLQLAYLVLDADNRVLEWNPAAEKLFGYARDEVVGRVALDLILPLPTNDQVREVLGRIRAGDMDAHSVSENQTKDGRIITCEWFNTPLLGADGRYAGVISLAQDITERKRAEDRLRRSEATLAGAERLAHLGSWEWHLPTSAVTWSEELYRILGLRPDDCGASFEAFLERVHPDDRQPVQAFTEQVLRNHASFENRFRIVHADGTVRRIRACGQVVVDESEKPVCMFGAIHDVTEGEQVEELLEESRRRFQAVFENSLDAILLMDDAGRYVDGNPAVCQLLGYSQEELPRLTAWDITPVQDRERIPESLSGFFSAGTQSGEYTLLHKGGATREVEYRAVANILPGLHLAVHRDVTERKQARRALEEQAARMQALSRRLVEIQEEERRHLARELHDEIGQTLTSLKFALEASAAAPPEAAGAKLGEARALIGEALTQVRELSFDLRPALLDHLGLLPALRWLFERYAGSTGVRVNFRQTGLETRFAPELETAAYRIVQEALTNVARHAHVSEAAVRIWVETDFLNVQVEDEGVGFDREALPAVGHSNGLPGMHERVLLLGGRLAIESAPGSGTHLLAELPAAGHAGGKIVEHFQRLGR